MIVCHMLVGPGESKNRLAVVLDRAGSWADELFCVLDPACTSADRKLVDDHSTSWWQSNHLFLLDEAAARETAWNLMTIALAPADDDWIVCLDADEVIHQPALVRQAAKTFTRKKVGFTVYNLWNQTEYRTDGRFAPKIEYLMFPYQSRAHWPRGSLSRVPAYAQALLGVAEPLTDIIHYGYRTPELRQEKLRRDHARGLMEPAEIEAEPKLSPWTKGGLNRG